MHGTTRELIAGALGHGSVQYAAVLNGRPPYLYSDDELRKVARDAYVTWHASRYSVPWQYVGRRYGCASKE